MRTIAQLQDMQHTWTLITGGAGHVGRTAAETILELGGKVILADRHSEALNAAIEGQFKDAYAQKRIAIVSVDLAQSSDISEMMREVETITGGTLNCLINNAAFVGTDNLTGWCVPFAQQSLETFKACIDVNLTAPFQISQQACQLMARSEHKVKSIINISSIYGVVGPQMDLYAGTDMGNPAAYAASKAGLMQLTRWMAPVVAPQIRVNTLLLGGIERGQPESFSKKYNSKVPLDRMATEEDVKGAIAYLASQLSNYMTGQTLSLDGGWTAV
ncbi:SDR family oxidoreductase [Pseudoalteromonas rubra]|uniref:Short-chain dehydrogenase n=1 Tax=Pseudoalteromonas rubra TaxID=43658 RepID=A0A4V2E2Z1_9GAMM|nr:SDR family oxidoreductase [Pseudoalteromonas rubra]RZM80277.1 short-chain dehydrogenase [Pseudoalteromonas rubra]